MNVKLKIGACVIRPSTPQDIDLVYSSWLNSYRESPKTHPMRNSIYYDGEHRVIDQTVARKGTEILCAVNPEDKAQILGWICAERFDGALMVHYVFVKSPYRRLGICKALLSVVGAEPPWQYSHWTRDGAQVAAACGGSYNSYQQVTA